jgi:hypothetical protein
MRKLHERQIQIFGRTHEAHAPVPSLAAAA